MSNVYSWDEIKTHTSMKNRLWIVIKGVVYDVTQFALEHPGGEDILLEHGGKDATNDFNDIGHSKDADRYMEKLKIGTVAP